MPPGSPPCLIVRARKILKVVLISVVSLALLVFTCLIGVNGVLSALFPQSRDVIDKQTSPDGRFQAVLVETKGGATTGFGYYVYVEAADSQAQDHLAAMVYKGRRRKSGRGLDLHWANARTLRIDFVAARFMRDVKQQLQVEGQTFNINVVGELEKPVPPRELGP